MHEWIRNNRFLTAVVLTAVFLAAAAGPLILKAEDDARNRCLEYFQIVVELIQFFYSQWPPLEYALFIQAFPGYEFCLRYIDPYLG